MGAIFRKFLETCQALGPNCKAQFGRLSDVFAKEGLPGVLNAVDEVVGVRLMHGWWGYQHGHADALGVRQKRQLFEPTVLRFEGDGKFFLANHPTKGWSSFGYRYLTINEVLEDWNVVLGPHGFDACSPYIEVHPAQVSL